MPFYGQTLQGFLLANPLLWGSWMNWLTLTVQMIFKRSERRNIDLLQNNIANFYLSAFYLPLSGWQQDVCWENRIIK